MGTREDAVELLKKMCFHVPKSLFCKLEPIQRGGGFVLAYLTQSKSEVNAGDLAKELNVSTARIAAILKAMEKDGLITRHGSSEDARRTIVELTPAGTTRAAEIREEVLSRVEMLLNKVEKRDLEEFIRISQEINEAMNE